MKVLWFPMTDGRRQMCEERIRVDRPSPSYSVRKVEVIGWSVTMVKVKISTKCWWKMLIPLWWSAKCALAVRARYYIGEGFAAAREFAAARSGRSVTMSGDYA